MSDTGPDRRTRELVRRRAERFGVAVCERCGAQVGSNVQHRRARGAGGTSLPDANFPSNLLWLCGSGTTGCHGYVTAHPDEAFSFGWAVRHGVDPTVMPVKIHDLGWAWLDDSGGYHTSRRDLPF